LSTAYIQSHLPYISTKSIYSQQKKPKGGYFLLYENISALCKEKQITIAELERNTGLGNGVIGKWRTTNSATLSKVKTIADYFEVTLDELVSTKG
jgi:hypothetical protein